MVRCKRWVQRTEKWVANRLMSRRERMEAWEYRRPKEKIRIHLSFYGQDNFNPAKTQDINYKGVIGYD
jgi:hypothetical protein